MTQHLDEILAELSAREPLFHRLGSKVDRTALEAMMATDFWEVGASGNIYHREFVIETILQRQGSDHSDEWVCSDFALRSLGSDHFLITYRLEQPARPTRRSTIWKRTADGWQILYHQGTIINDS